MYCGVKEHYNWNACKVTKRLEIWTQLRKFGVSLWSGLGEYPLKDNKPMIKDDGFQFLA